MKIKIKLESLENILNLSNSFCTIPIIMDKSMMFGAYGVDLNMSEYIWYQLPKECKNKIYNYKEVKANQLILPFIFWERRFQKEDKNEVEERGKSNLLLTTEKYLIKYE